MLVNIKHKEVKVRRPNSHLFKGEDKFTGTVTYSVVGSVDHEPIRLSLGTEGIEAGPWRFKHCPRYCNPSPGVQIWRRERTDGAEAHRSEERIEAGGKSSE